jgi:tRNA (cmo5U34)-methyltransferase
MIKKSKGSWNFKNMEKKFDNHIRKSIPLYEHTHDIILRYSHFFVHKDSNIYDLGCSTGKLIQKLSNYLNNKGNYFGIDNEKTMANFAKKKFKKEKNIMIEFKDINQVKFKKSSYIISAYTLQFIKPETRLKLLKKIYKSLEWGGSFIYFEKVRAEDARFQEYATTIYNEFKLNNGFTASEILNKNLSLKGVMEPYSEKGNLTQLKAAGFKDISTIYKFLCFQGFLCIK